MILLHFTVSTFGSFAHCSPVWVCTKGFLSHPLQWEKVPALPVLCSARLAGRNLRLSLRRRLQARRHHRRLLGNHDAHGRGWIHRCHQEDHQHSTQDQIRVRHSKLELWKKEKCISVTPICFIMVQNVKLKIEIGVRDFFRDKPLFKQTTNRAQTDQH